MNAKKTREVILDNAIDIFNEKKPSKVSTVQIADYMGISPGNLYYYFGNKEEIIRCIWKERILKDIRTVFATHATVHDGANLVQFYKDAIGHIKAYRFFYSEISTLLNNDKVLQNEMTISITRNKRNLFTFVEELAQAGLFKPLTVDEKIRASDIMCAVLGKAFYSNYAYSFYEEAGQEIDNVLLVNIFVAMKPYLTESCWEEIMADLTDKGISYQNNAEILREQYISM